MDLAALLAQRIVPWSNARAVAGTVAVTDAGATLILDTAAVHAIIGNAGPNPMFLRLDGTAGVDGTPIPSGGTLLVDVTGGMTLAFDCATGETATAHVQQLLGAP
jgi:hypothetical protein